MFVGTLVLLVGISLFLFFNKIDHSPIYISIAFMSLL